MNKNIKLIATISALAIGGYLIYKYYFKSNATSESSSTQSSSTTATQSSSTISSSTNNTPVESSSTTPSSSNNVENNSNTSYQTYGNTNLVNNIAYQNYVKAVESGEVQDTYQNYMASVPEENTPPAQYLNNYVSTTKVSTNISSLPGWLQAEIKSGQIASYTDVNTGTTYV